MAKNNSRTEMALLESCLRDDLNKRAPRAMAVLDPLKLIIENSIEARLLEVQKKKTELANLTLGPPLSKSDLQARRLEELQQLFAA